MVCGGPNQHQIAIRVVLAPQHQEPPVPVHKHSPIFVHHTEGKGKTGSNLFKLFLRNISILVMIIVLEDGLWGKKEFLWWLPKQNHSFLSGAGISDKSLSSAWMRERGDVIPKPQRSTGAHGRSALVPCLRGLGAYRGCSALPLFQCCCQKPSGSAPSPLVLHCSWFCYILALTFLLLPRIGPQWWI